MLKKFKNDAKAIKFLFSVAFKQLQWITIGRTLVQSALDERVKNDHRNGFNHHELAKKDNGKCLQYMVIESYFVISQQPSFCFVGKEVIALNRASKTTLP